MGRALSQTAGTAVIRLADADILPLQFSDFAGTVRNYVDELKKLANDQRAQIIERNREIDEGAFAAAADPRERYVPPSKEAVPPHLNFAPLENSIDALSGSAERYDAARQKANSSDAAKVNADLIESERNLTDSAGLPGRPWYRNLIYAPGLYTGYGVKTIRGVREAIEQKHWPQADEEIQRAGRLLTKEAEILDQATAALGRARS